MGRLRDDRTIGGNGVLSAPEHAIGVAEADAVARRAWIVPGEILQDRDLLLLPAEVALPCQLASKFAPPSPRLGWVGSPVPSPWGRLPHSTIDFQNACSAPTHPGKLEWGVVLSFAVGSAKLLKTRTWR